MFGTTAERLRWLRKFRCHKTQLEIGKKVGVGKATIQKYECGVITNIPPDKVELLAEALETTPGFIMGCENAQNKIRHTRRCAAGLSGKAIAGLEAGG